MKFNNQDNVYTKEEYQKTFYQKNDMEMPRREVDGQTEVTLDPDKFESVR